MAIISGPGGPASRIIRAGPPVSGSTAAVIKKVTEAALVKRAKESEEEKKRAVEQKRKAGTILTKTVKGKVNREAPVEVTKTVEGKVNLEPPVEVTRTVKGKVNREAAEEVTRTVKGKVNREAPVEVTRTKLVGVRRIKKPSVVVPPSSPSEDIPNAPDGTPPPPDARQGGLWRNQGGTWVWSNPPPVSQPPPSAEGVPPAPDGTPPPPDAEIGGHWSLHAPPQGESKSTWVWHDPLPLPPPDLPKVGDSFMGGTVTWVNKDAGTVRIEAGDGAAIVGVDGVSVAVAFYTLLDGQWVQTNRAGAPVARGVSYRGYIPKDILDMGNPWLMLFYLDKTGAPNAVLLDLLDHYSSLSLKNATGKKGRDIINRLIDELKSADKELSTFENVFEAVNGGFSKERLLSAGYSPDFVDAVFALRKYINEKNEIDVERALKDGVDEKYLVALGFSVTGINRQNKYLKDLPKLKADLAEFLGYKVTDKNLEEALKEYGKKVEEHNTKLLADLTEFLGYKVTDKNLEKAFKEYIKKFEAALSALQPYQIEYLDAETQAKLSQGIYTPVKKQTGYDLPAALIGGVKPQMILAIFGQDELNRAKASVEARDSLDKYINKDGSIDIFGALNAGLDSELKVIGLKTWAINDAEKQLEALGALSKYELKNSPISGLPYPDGPHHNLIAALLDKVPITTLLTAGFSQQAIDEAKEQITKGDPSWDWFQANYTGDGIKGEAGEVYLDRYGMDAFIRSAYTDLAAFIFPPARALKPEVKLKDISGGEWAWGAVNVALLTLPFTLKVVRGIKFTSVKQPLKAGGYNVVWKGLTITDRPLIGRAGGKWTLGAKNITLTQARKILNGWKPETVLETRVIIDPKRLAAAGHTEVEVNKIIASVKARGLFAGKASPNVPKTVEAEPIKALSAKGVQEVMKIVVRFGKRVKTVYGSFSLKPQLVKSLQTGRIPADIDIMLKMTQAEFDDFMKAVLKALKRTEGAKNVRLAKGQPGLIEVKKGGVWHHAIDAHAEGITSASGVASEGAYGMLHAETPITVKYPGIGRVRLMTASETGKRKMSSILEWRDGAVGPAPHRMKDIADFYLILRNFKGKAIADWWAKEFGYSADDLLKLAKKAPVNMELIGWEYVPKASGAIGAAPVVTITVPRSLAAGLSPKLLKAISKPVSPYLPPSKAASQVVSPSPSPSPGSYTPSYTSLPSSMLYKSASPSSSKSLASLSKSPLSKMSKSASPSPSPSKSPSKGLSKSPSPSPSPSPSRSASASPSPSPSLSPSPSPSLSPSPTPSPTPTTTTTTTKTTTKPPPPPKDSEEEKKRLVDAEGLMHWRQGALKRGDELKDQWVSVVPRGGGKTMLVYTENPPRGHGPLKGTPEETFFTRGDRPPKEVLIAMGIQNVKVDATGEPNLNFRLRRGGRRRRRRY